MGVTRDRQSVDREFLIEDMSTGAFASGFGHLADGCSFAFHVDHRLLTVEVYRPGLVGPVPQPEDVVATSSRNLVHVDVADERSLAAAVRDAVSSAR